MIQQQKHSHLHNPSQLQIALKSLNQDFLIAYNTSVSKPKYQKLSIHKPSSRIDKMLKCPLCNNTFTEPVTDPCGHTFCSQCITEVREIVNCCPVTSNQYETKDSFAPNILLNSLINKETPCENYFAGCLWYGDIQQMNEHIKKECDFACVECVNQACKRVFARNEIKNHLLECSYNNIMCKFCGWSGFIYEAEQHQNKCPEKEILCPFNCGQIFKRKDICRHNLECKGNELKVLFDEMNKLQYEKNLIIDSNEGQLNEIYNQKTSPIMNKDEMRIQNEKIIKEQEQFMKELRKISEESEINPLSSRKNENCFRKVCQHNDQKKTVINKADQEKKESWERMLDLGSMELEGTRLIKEKSWSAFFNDGDGKLKAFCRDGRS